MMPLTHMRLMNFKDHFNETVNFKFATIYVYFDFDCINYNININYDITIIIVLIFYQITNALFCIMPLKLPPFRTNRKMCCRVCRTLLLSFEAKEEKEEIFL